MHELIKLKDMLCEELEKYGAKGELSSGSLEVVDKLAHAVKSLCVIIDMCDDEEYSQSNGMRYSYDHGTNGNGMRYGRSYARGRGTNARRDSMERYSSAGDFEAQLTDLISDAPNEEIRRKLQQLMNDMH